MCLVSSCRCLFPIHWSKGLSREWKCSWSSADRRCSNYIWVISNFIASIRWGLYHNPSPPRMFLSLDLLSEYRIQHGANGPLYVTSSYSTWIFCGGVSGFATDCPFGRRLVSWINHLPPACWSTFWKSNFKQQLGCRFDIMDNIYYFFVCFDICNHICLGTSDHFSVLPS